MRLHASGIRSSDFRIAGPLARFDKPAIGLDRADVVGCTVLAIYHGIFLVVPDLGFHLIANLGLWAICPLGVVVPDERQGIARLWQGGAVLFCLDCRCTGCVRICDSDFDIGDAAIVVGRIGDGSDIFDGSGNSRERRDLVRYACSAGKARYESDFGDSQGSQCGSCHHECLLHGSLRSLDASKT